jgi:hypothetical protein
MNTTTRWKRKAAILATAVALAGTLTVPGAYAIDYTAPAVDVRTGTVVTFTNSTAVATYGYLYYVTAATGVTFTTTDPNAMLATNPHASTVRIRVGAKWVTRVVNTGYDISVVVDPFETVTVVASKP